jgi:hypothetical protein
LAAKLQTAIDSGDTAEYERRREIAIGVFEITIVTSMCTSIASLAQTWWPSSPVSCVTVEVEVAGWAGFYA